jgi:signal transduction histidine kinase
MDTRERLEPAVPILIVDDRAEKRLAIRSLLDDLPWTIVEADSGEAGLREILKSDFALVILDVYMPGMDGFELARLIRERPRTKYLPILFHSAEEPTRQQILKAYRLGVVDYLVQPVLPEILLAKVGVFVDLFIKGKLLEQQKEEVEQLREAQMNAKLLRTQAALDQAELRLAEARRMESLGKLAGGIAHEFNNIMAGIMGMAHLVRESMIEPSPMRENMDLIIAGSERAAKLTSEVLSYARKQRLSPAVLDLNRLGPKWIEEFSKQESKVDLNWRPADGPAFVLIDEERMAEAISHLLMNSAEAGARQLGLKVAVQMESEPDGGQEAAESVLLEITDDGRGMEPEILKKCLEPFFTTKGPNQGAGMGLSMAQGFVKQSGGTFSIASRPGVGTQVQLRFARVSPGHAPDIQPMRAEKVAN